MGLIKFLVGGCLALVGFFMIFAVIVSAPIVAFATGSLWGSVIFGFVGFIIFLIGVYLMRSNSKHRT